MGLYMWGPTLLPYSPTLPTHYPPFHGTVGMSFGPTLSTTPWNYRTVLWSYTTHHTMGLQDCPMVLHYPPHHGTIGLSYGPTLPKIPWSKVLQWPTVEDLKSHVLRVLWLLQDYRNILHIVLQLLSWNPMVLYSLLDPMLSELNQTVSQTVF